MCDTQCIKVTCLFDGCLKNPNAVNQMEHDVLNYGGGGLL